MYKALIGNIRRAKDLGREEALKEVLGWLEENFFITDIEQIDSYLPKYVLGGNFESKEQCFNHLKNNLILSNYESKYI